MRDIASQMMQAKENITSTASPDAGTTDEAPPRTAAGRFEFDRRLLLIVWPLLVVVCLLVTLDMLRADVLSSVRAYVSGESLWSKAQKDAVYHLVRYARSRDDADLEQFADTVSVPLGDRIARIELQKTRPDLAVVRRGFLDGGNDADDIDGMIHLFRRFSHVGALERAIAIWTEADVQIQALVADAQSLHDAVDSGSGDPDEVRVILDRVRDTDLRLTPLERQFSATLGEASRGVQHVMDAVMLALAVMLVLIGLFLSGRMLRRGDAVQEALRVSDARYLQAAALERQAAQSLRSLQGLLTAAPAAFVAWNARSGVILWSDVAEQLFGIHRADAIGKPPPWSLAAVMKLAARLGEDSDGPSSVVGVSLDLVDQRGRPLPSTTSLSRLPSVGGEADTFVALIEDMTPARLRELRRIESLRAQRDALIRQTHHRITRQLQGLAAMLRHPSGDGVLEPRLDAAVGHVLTIAVVHSLKGEDEAAGLSLQALLDRIAKSVSAHTHVPIVLSGSLAKLPRLIVDDEQSVPLAIVLNELVVNAVRHRGQATVHDVIDIELWQEGDTATLSISHLGELPTGFSFACGSGLGAGLGLVRSLLVQRDIQLDIRRVGMQVVTRLVLGRSCIALERARAVSEPARALAN